MESYATDRGRWSQVHTPVAETLPSILPDDVRKAFPPDTFKLSEFESLRRSRKEHKDVGFVTVIGKELQAVLTALGRLPDAGPDEKSGDFSYWLADIPRIAGRPLRVVVTMVGEPRNVPCAIAVERLLSDYNIATLIMTGVAAGPRKKVHLGDVVYADQVYDYEEHRLEMVRWWGITTWLRRQRPRPRYISTRKAVKIALERLNIARCDRAFEEALRRVPEDLLPQQYERTRKPKIHDGTIAAGEKLVADGTIDRMRRLDERIRALSMEDSGFAQVAEIKGIPWCIFRGISDYGDPHKESGWQYVATLAAACAALTFLKFAWDPPQFEGVGSARLSGG